MSRLILKSCSLRNWGTVADSRIEFPSSGLVHVTGVNLASRGAMESVASGKSLLGEAISRALFDTPGRFSRLRDYSRDDQGNTYCQVHCELDGKPLVVELGYKCPELSKTGEGLRYTLGSDTPVMHGSVANTRRDLAAMIGVSDSVANWTVFVDGDRVDFARLSEANSVRLLMEVLNQPPWEQYCAAARTRKNAFATTIAKLGGKTALLKSQIVAAENALARADQEFIEKASALESAAAIKAAADAARATRIEVLEHSINVAQQTESDARSAMLRLERQIADQTAALDRDYHAAVSAKSAAESELSRLRLLAKSTDTSIASKNAEIARMISDWRLAEGRRTSSLYNGKMAVWRTRERLAAELTKLAGDRARLSELEAERTEANQPLPCRVGGCGRLVPPDEIKVRAISDKIAVAARVQSETQRKCDQLLASIQSVLDGTEDLTNAGPEPQREIDNEPPQDLCDAAQREKLELELLSEKVKQEIAALEQQIRNELQAAVDTTRQKLESHGDLQEYHSLSDQIRVAQATARQSQAEITRLQVETAASNVAKETAAVATAEDAVRRLREQLDQLGRQLKSVQSDELEVTQLHSVCQYWESAFSPTGIPNVVIGTAIDQLNVCAQQISHRLTAGILSVRYNTTRELASGGRSNEIVLEVVNPHGSSKATGVSKGECGLVNLVVSETLSEIGLMASRVGYRWLDEVVTSQDQVVRRAMFNYFRELAETRQIVIFMVDHSTEIAGYATHHLVATKSEDGLTTYSWR